MSNGAGGVSGDCGGAGAPAAIAHSVDLLRGMMQRPGYAYSDAEVLDNLRRLYAMASVVEAAKLRFVAELQARPEAVAGARPGRAAHTFLTEALRVSGPQAHRDVAAAAALASSAPELPLMAQALADGEVSRDHVDAAVSTMRRLPKVLKKAIIEPEPQPRPQPEADVQVDSEPRPEPEPEPGPGPMTGAELIDEILTGQAKVLPPTTVERLGRQIVRRLDPTRAERFDPEAFERRTCSIGTDFAGMGIYRLVVDQATHLQVRALIARWAAPRPAGEAVNEAGDVVTVKDVRTPGQRQADALVDLILAGGATQPLTRDPDDDTDDTDTDADDTDTADAEDDACGAADAGDGCDDDAEGADAPVCGGRVSGGGAAGAAFFLAPPVVTAEVTIIATLDQFAAAFGADDPGARAGGMARMSLAGTVGDFAGSSVHPEVLARLSCDSPIRRILVGENNVPLHHGRSRRLASAAQKRALAARDGGCVVPGCPAPPEWTEAHHIIPWEKGGQTDIDAMVLLCSRHHTAHHAGVYDIELREGVAWVRVPGWQDIGRPWLCNISATHGSLAERVARVVGSQPRLPWRDRDCGTAA